MPTDRLVTRETLRIILVENDPDDVFFLERALLKGGFVHPLIHFSDAADAVAYLARPDAALPDIILSDIKMPRLSGIDFLQWLRGTPHLKDLPVIILTSSSETPDLRQTTRLGIFKFITKQVRYANVVSTLDLFVASLGQSGFASNG